MSITTALKTGSFPTLADMGVTRPTEISSYKLRSNGKKNDVLKIRYKREKGSFLPHSRTYKFGRSLKAVVADGGTARIENTYEISPLLLRAVAELDSLVQQDKGASESKASRSKDSKRRTELLSELDGLETMLAGDTAETNPSAVSARFANIRARIEAL